MEPTLEERREQRPQALFKYCTSDRIDVLENLKIRFTQPALFNDIFECFPGTDRRTDYGQALRNAVAGVERTLAHHPHWDRKTRRAYERDEMKRFKQWCRSDHEKPYYEKVCEDTQARISAVTCILCLTAKWDNILMWAHYTLDHQGFVIELDGHHPFFDHGFEKVVYSNERPLLQEKPMEKQADGRVFGADDGKIFSTKSTDWAYEEYRLIHNIGEEIPLPNGNTYVKFPELEDIDRINWSLELRDLPPLAVRKVILGYRMSAEAQKQVIAALKKPVLKHVKLAQVRPHRQFFRMEQVPLQR